MIVTNDVHMHFRQGIWGRQVRALNGMSLQVNEGDFFALVGQNGAGKSTAMYCLLGLLRPTSGSISVMGQEPMLGSNLYRDVAYLSEEPHYHLYMTVEEAVRYYASLYGARVSSQAVSASLEQLGLAQFKTLPLSKCSKGMKQKVGIAQCLIHETRVLFLDEPTRGLDPLVVREFRETLREIHRRGATIVMNSHVLSEIEMLANRVAILEAGKVLAQDDLANLTTLNRELYTIAFEGNGTAPEYLSGAVKTGNIIRGNIPKERLFDFMELARVHALVVHECSLRRNSLEDSFFRIIRGGESQAEGNKGTEARS